MSNNYNADDDRKQVSRRPSLSLKMQQSLRKMKKSIQKITESSTTVQPHCVFVENVHDDESHLPYIFPERLTSLTCQTGFSKDEIRKLYRAFKQHCPRGIVTTNDFDRDGDGIVSFEDLLTEIALIVNGDIDQKLSWIFRFYDLNGDGCITRKEMLVIVSAIYEMVHSGHTVHRLINKHVDKLFKKMDVDKDGVISREEFMICCKNVNSYI